MRCELCGSDRRNSIKYGEFLTKNGKGVHTNCLYLSSGLKQNGSENNGMLGFLPEDIAAERARVSTIQCCYCGKMSANIGCCGTRCYRTFHMICGIESGAMNQFLRTFRSFCNRHVRKVRLRPKQDDVCYICYDKIFNECKSFNAVEMIRAPCCRNGWFHKYCLQKFAKSAGYFFKCPLCNDGQNFKNNMSYWGIFVYDKDAEWELVPNAYAELLERPSDCGAEICRNTVGRGHSNDTNPFVYCDTCGSVAIHRNCMSHRDVSFECDNCKQILNNDSGRESIGSQQQYVAQTNGLTEVVKEDENSDVDVCGETDDEVINDKPQQEDSDEDIVRPNIRKRNLFGILNDTEEATGSDSETSTVREHVQQRREVNERNIIELKIVGSVSDNDMLNYRIEDSLCTSGNEADDEGLEDTFEDKQKMSDTSWCATESSAIHENISITKGEPLIESNVQVQNVQHNNPINISCIAQRTRRKSIVEHPALLTNYQEPTTDDTSSTCSYQSSKPYEVFQYDDGENNIQNKDEETSDNETNCGRGVLDYFYALLNEVKKETKKTDQTALQNEETNNITNDVIKPQNGSCIAHRTRRRSSANSKISADDMSSLKSSSSYKPSEDLESDILDTNCIAKRTRRRLSIPDEIKTNKKDDVKEENFLNVSCVAKRTRRQSICVDKLYIDSRDNGSNNINNQCNASPSTSSATSSSTDSFKSSTFFGSTLEYAYENKIETNCENTAQTLANSNRTQSLSNRASTSKDRGAIKQSELKAQKRKVGFDLPMPSKFAALSQDASVSEEHNNVFSKSCIANRTRRKSLDANTFFQTTNMEDSNEDTSNELIATSKYSAITETESEPVDHSNAIERSCIANRTRRKSLDANTFNKTYTVEEDNDSFTTDDVPATNILAESSVESSPSVINLITPSTDSTLSSGLDSDVEPSGPRRSQRQRARPQQYLERNNNLSVTSSNIVHTPIPKSTHWSNLKKDREVAYFMPRLTRINEKFVQVSATTLRRRQQQQQHSLDVQTHFARSYNLLLQDAMANRGASNSRL